MTTAPKSIHAGIEHAFPFDPTYGYTLPELLQVRGPETPPDFAAFWQANYEQTLARPTRASLRPTDLGHDRVEVFEVEYDGFDGFRVGGWLTRPRGVKATRGIVLGHGYGGRSAPDLGLMDPPAVMIQPCARGFHRSARPDVPGEAMNHVVHGIEHRDTYLIRHCVMDLWSAVSALIELEPQVAQRVEYIGGSFGGGLGALAIPWERRFTRAFLKVPTFGNYPLRVHFECVGSNSAVRKRFLEDPSIMDVLAYFDAAVAARHTRIPTAVNAAPFDPAVPPPGQFCVYNELPGQKALAITSADHFEYPNRAAELAEMHRRACEWLNGERDDIGDCRITS